MSRGIPPRPKKSSAQFARLLVGSFVLTIASFIAASVVSEYRARGIGAAAQNIATNAVPTVDCVSRSRTDLHRVSVALELLTAPTHTHDVVGRRERLRGARAALTRTWQACLSLPTYADEAALQREVRIGMSDMDLAIARVLDQLDQGDVRQAAELAAKAQPSIDHVDQLMVTETDLNVRESAALGAHIAYLKRTSEATVFILDLVCALLAVIAAALMIRLLRRYAALVETHMSDLEQFSSRVAHDIRSPLAAVGLALELMKRDPEKGLRMGALDRAARSLQRVVRLVDDLLVFARAGAVPPETARADAGDVIDGVLDQLRAPAEESAITLSREPVEPPITVAASPGVLSSILSNLLGNAIKHMGNSPVRAVSVRTHDLGRAARFEVSDTGPGVDPALRAHMFEPYVRGAGATVPGLGLGLATVRRLIEAHGGAVGWLPNRGPGGTFWFELPMVAAQEPERPPAAAAPAAPTAEPAEGSAGPS